jgi:hypothetical protein
MLDEAIEYLKSLQLQLTSLILPKKMGDYIFFERMAKAYTFPNFY